MNPSPEEARWHRFALALRKILMVVVLSPLLARADYTTTINPQTTWGIWEGWGNSLCWWANVFGTRDDLADIVFTTNYTAFNGVSLPGLGMNIARYNAGACSWNSINAEAMQASPNIPAFRQIEGYWQDWFSADPTTGSWNWTVDANQRSMLLKAKARGVNLFELFSNSPMWWMCYNHNPSGSDAGTSDNLQSWNDNQHAIYLAAIAQYANDHWGITFDSVEAFNEPSAGWWNSNGAQEGSHFDVGTQAAVIGYLRAELDNRGLTNVNVAASDETSYDDARTTWINLPSARQSQIGRLNVHGYQYGGGRRDLLYTAVVGKRLWNSEYGESDGSGVSLASNLNLDFRWLHPTAWCYWQAFDSGGWGLIQSNPGDNWIGPPNPKYYVLAHYTRHIRPGMTIIDGGEGNTVAAYQPATRKLVIVTMNYGTAQTITYDLANCYKAVGPVRRWTTVTGLGAKYVQSSGPIVNNKALQSFFSINTIQTLEIQNVDLYPPPQMNISRIAPNGQFELTWPATASGYNLYSTASLINPAAWQLMTNTPASSNGIYHLVLPASDGSQRFFRLSNP